MSSETVVRAYFEAIEHGGWEGYIADDFSFANGNFDDVPNGRAAYLHGAGRFFATTTSIEVREMVVSGNKVAVFARYHVQSRRGTPGVCDVAELLTVSDDKLTSSAIIFDAKTLAQFMAES